MQEMLASAETATTNGHREVDVDDLLDDPELERLHAERLAALQKEAEKRAKLQRKGHGELQEVYSSPVYQREQGFHTASSQYSMISQVLLLAP